MYGYGKRISEREFKKAIDTLHDKNLPRHLIEKIKMGLGGQINDSGSQSGITEKEFDSHLDYLEKNRSHGFSDEHLNTVREAFDPHFKN